MNSDKIELPEHKWMDPVEYYKSKKDFEDCWYGTVSEIIEVTSRYGVIRRSVLNALYNPYFVDFGYNKMEFFRRLMIERRYCGSIEWQIISSIF